MRHITSWRDDAGAFPPEERIKPVVRNHTGSIRFQRDRGMSEESLVRIYGLTAVHEALHGGGK